MSVNLRENPTTNKQPLPHETKQNLDGAYGGISHLWQLRQLIALMVKRDLMGRYKGSFLGALWPLINPLGHLLLYTFVFSIVLKVRFGDSNSTSNFALYLMTGLIPWGAFSEALSRSTTAILEVPNLVKRVVFPLEILPLVTVLSAFLGQIVALPCVLIAAGLYFGKLHATILFLPLIIIAQIVLTSGISWILASLGVYVRDIRHFMSLGLSAWMYGTPIVYPASALPDSLKFLSVINPVAGLVEDYRRVVLEGLPPVWTTFCIYSTLAVIVWVFGYYFFCKTKRSFADVM
jgi:lipopolysaccharide transport system permease protein